MLWLDDYERRARLVPGLLLVAPVAIVVLMFSLKGNPVVAGIVGSLTAFGAPVVLANVVRHRGLAVQDDLWQAWGGKPTNQLLQTGPSGRRDHWRAAVEAVSGQTLPTPGQPDPDGHYDAAVATVISDTRDPKHFKLVFNENRNYGYERNLYGLRKLGLIVALACLVGSAAAVAVLVVADHAARPEWIVGLVALLGLVGVWIYLPSSTRARTTAFKYAEQLLDAAVELSRKSGG